MVVHTLTPFLFFEAPARPHFHRFLASFSSIYKCKLSPAASCPYHSKDYCAYKMRIIVSIELFWYFYQRDLKACLSYLLIRLEEEDWSMYSSYWYTRMECRCYRVNRRPQWPFEQNLDKFEELMVQRSTSKFKKYDFSELLMADLCRFKT